MKDKTRSQPISKTITIPIRVQGRTTSIMLKKSNVILWILFIVDPKTKTAYGLKNQILNFVYRCLDLWEGENARGFSDFVMEKMILDLLEKEDLVKYNQIAKILADL